MFRQTYKTTLKNLFRSALFWIMFILLIGNTLYSVNQGHNGYYDKNYNKLIMDTDPEFIMNYGTYRELADNTVWADVMLYAMPAFAVVSVIVILNRDYGDGFFEIEKAGGVKTRQYYFGRLAALVSMNGILGLIVTFIGYHWYYFSRGGYPGLALKQFLAESTVRILRTYFFMAFPVLILFIGITYFVGSLLQNGFAGGLAGLSYVLLTYLFGYQLQFRMSTEYNDYIKPGSSGMRAYWKVFHDPEPYLDARNFFRVPDVLHWYAYILGGAIVFLVLAYVFTRHRKT